MILLMAIVTGLLIRSYSVHRKVARAIGQNNGGNQEAVEIMEVVDDLEKNDALGDEVDNKGNNASHLSSQ